MSTKRKQVPLMNLHHGPDYVPDYGERGQLNAEIRRRAEAYTRLVEALRELGED